jgi:hypothetical protein
MQTKGSLKLERSFQASSGSSEVEFLSELSAPIRAFALFTAACLLKLIALISRS